MHKSGFAPCRCWMDILLRDQYARVAEDFHNGGGSGPRLANAHGRCVPEVINAKSEPGLLERSVTLRLNRAARRRAPSRALEHKANLRFTGPLVAPLEDRIDPQDPHSKR